MQEIFHRNIQSFRLTENVTGFIEQLLCWCNQYSIFAFLDSCGYSDKYGKFDCIAAVGVHRAFEEGFHGFHHFETGIHDWLFGHFSFEMDTTIVSSDFPTLFFFQPSIVLYIKNHRFTIEAIDFSPQKIFDEILSVKISDNLAVPQGEIQFEAELEKEEYIARIEKIKAHIHRGDCYELNFCTRFSVEHYQCEPILLYKKLKKISPNPFSCFYKKDNMVLLCASPERFLQKEGKQIISQPIKGTIGRNLENAVQDEVNKQVLQNSQKEKSEHVMAVDLARNDLSRFCEAGSVHVQDLYGIYPFPHVYQMISTVIGEVPPGISFSDIIAATFPMASMTGAPKKKVLELISKYEKNKRGIFSGTVGYISPQKNADFNVVIRSMIYNTQTNFLYFPVGGGITFLSEPEAEYEECLLKTKAIRKVLS